MSEHRSAFYWGCTPVKALEIAWLYHLWAMCRRVLAILNNRLETVDLLREEEYDPVGDFLKGPIQFAVIRFRDLDVHVSLDTVVFLK
jgi:hypothetical protein